MDALLDAIALNVPLKLLDVIAVALFIALWFGYGWYADFSATSRPRLGMELARYTHDWFERMVERENRMVDVNILRILSRSSQFFAQSIDEPEQDGLFILRDFKVHFLVHRRPLEKTLDEMGFARVLRV